ncbi:MAG: 2-isopropylmalate synthase [Elusimicrobia bacterium]|jgi:2-isopropylmalate synthase|nr:2-isopropylmalate synthase [Elusimicrobiota bacterium]
MKKTDRLIIFDTTLRDGEQSPGASLNIPEKLQAARQLAELGVDVIEAGFPVSSPGDFEAVKTIAQEIRGAEICGLARAVKGDIDACWNAVKHSKRPRIHTFIATSDLHIVQKLRMTRQQVLDRAVECVRYASQFTENVEFSAEDAVRTDFDYLCQVIEAVIDAGAATVNIPDTVGYSIPSEWGEKIHRLISRVPNIKKAVVSVHCHNDLGLAVSNSLAAVQNGARQVECTVNGIGERAGNASLEEIVMAIRTRKDLFQLTSRVNTKEIARSSRLISKLTGIPVQPNKAVVGANAFAHSSGIHQDGVLKSRTTYEIMNPSDVGVEESALLLTARSGRNGVQNRLKHLGYTLTAPKLDVLFGKFKTLADKKKYVFDDDLLALVEEEGRDKTVEVFHLDYLNTTSGTGIVPTATVRLKKEGKVFQEAACGDGPVDAAYRAMDKITGLSPELKDYTLRSLSSGTDAQGDVVVKVENQGLVVSGKGTSTDIVEASAKAYLNALNKIISNPVGKKKPVVEKRGM